MEQNVREKKKKKIHETPKIKGPMIFLKKNHFRIDNSSTMAMLNCSYFDKLFYDENYESVRVKGRPMVLFSKQDKTPLVALQLKTLDTEKQNKKIGNRAKAAIVKRWNKSPLNCNFQGIFNGDEQEFGFVVTNLTSEQIRFEIHKADPNDPERTTDLERLNNVNCIKPWQSYTIQTDMKDSCSLIFSTIKDKTGKSSTTVKQDETENKESPKGTYYFITVNPEKGKENEKLFKETSWECVDGFIMKKYVPPNIDDDNDCIMETAISRSVDKRLAKGIGGVSPTYPPSSPSYSPTSPANEKYSDDEECLVLNPKTSGHHPMEAAMVIHPAAFSAAAANPAAFSASEKCAKTTKERCAKSKERRFDAPESQAKRQKISKCVQPSEEESTEKMDQGFLEDSVSIDTPLLPPTEKIVEMSYVGKVNSGRLIQESTSRSFTSFNTDIASEKCKIGLSVFKELTIDSNKSHRAELIRLGELEIKQLVEKKSVDESIDLFGKMKLFKENECHICEKEAPNLVLFQCGHCCLHKECFDKSQSKLVKCPWCHLFISGMISV